MPFLFLLLLVAGWAAQSRPAVGLGAFWSSTVATRALSDNPVIDQVTREPRNRLSWSAPTAAKIWTYLKPAVAIAASIFLTPAAGAAIYLADQQLLEQGRAAIIANNDAIATALATAPLENLHALFWQEVRKRQQAAGQDVSAWETDDAIRAVLKRGTSLGPSNAFAVAALIALISWKYGAPAFDTVIRGKWSDHGAYSDQKIDEFMRQLQAAGASYLAAHADRQPTFTGAPKAA